MGILKGIKERRSHKNILSIKGNGYIKEKAKQDLVELDL